MSFSNCSVLLEQENRKVAAIKSKTESLNVKNLISGFSILTDTTFIKSDSYPGPVVAQK